MNSPISQRPCPALLVLPRNKAYGIAVTRIYHSIPLNFVNFSWNGPMSKAEIVIQKLCKNKLLHKEKSIKSAVIPFPCQIKVEQTRAAASGQEKSRTRISRKIGSLNNLFNGFITECLHGQQLSVSTQTCLGSLELIFKHILKETETSWSELSHFISLLRITMRTSWKVDYPTYLLQHFFHLSLKHVVMAIIQHNTSG